MARTSKLHPFTVIALTAMTVAITTALNYWVVGCLVIIGCFILAVRAKCFKKLLGISAAIVLPAFASQLMIHGLISHDTAQALFQWGPIRITTPGIETSFILGLRTAVLVVAGLYCSLVIDHHQLVAAIDLSKAPPQLGYLVAATIFLMPQMAAKQRAIGEAQTLRNVGTAKGLRGWFQHVRLRAVPLVLGSLQDAASKAPHLAARGFPSAHRLTRLREVPDSATQRWVRYISAALVVLGPVLILVPDWGSVL